ncbi:MAG: family 43 glycosylhydrolase [Clostridia bacterium]|nr:family 43 glycosylhydrolase [Clostridia bacterium]
MKKTLRFASLLLAAIMLFACVPFVSAAEDIAGAEAAEALHSLGLLAGKGTNADGSVNFDLGGSLTRAESITQVVRFLGAEGKATSETNSHPFTDLPSWAVPYISYAYANGITQGVSATKFDSNTAMSEAAFLTAILRVLGYTDKNDGTGDFIWSNPYTLAANVGLIPGETPNTNFKRGDAFVICYNALTAAVKSGDKLCDSLVANGTVSAELMKSVIGSADTLTIGGVSIKNCSVVISEGANATVTILANNIVKAVNEAYGVTLPVIKDSTAKTGGEIVVGNTTREISAKLSEVGAGEVGIIVSGTSVALGGADNTYLRQAVTAFIDSYITYAPVLDLTEKDTYISALLSNPVRSLGQSGDPCVVYDEETEYYYAIYSAPKNDRVILYRSKTVAGLGNLDTADGKEIYVAGEDKEVKHKLYAPELKKMNGKWYIYASGATSMEDKDDAASKSIRLFCLEATSSDPYGDYVFKAFLDPDIWAIDAHPFTWQGENYIAFARILNGNIITVARLSDPWTIDNSRVTVIATPTYDFETQGGKVNEGPFTFVSPEGKLFMLYSANGVTSGFYCLGLLEFTGSDILSKASWTKYKEAVFSGTDSIKGPGHCSVFKSPDGTQYWLAYHYQSSGRKLGLQQFHFDENGIPVFGEPKAVGTGYMKPSGETI